MNTISNNDIARAIYLGTLDKKGAVLSSYFKDVAKFLARKRLISKTEGILESLGKIINQKEGIVLAKVSSVEKLNHKTKEDITHFLKKRYKAKEIILQELLDENLLGGYKVEVGDEVVDFSIKNRIDKLKAHLIK